MGVINKLSEQERERRLEILQRYDQWVKQYGSRSLLLFCTQEGDEKEDVAKCLKWRRAYNNYHASKERKREAATFIQLQPAMQKEEAVKLVIGSVSIEVGATSSKKALSTILSVLGVAHVL